MKTHTSNEFNELCILMDEEHEEHEPWMWYLAQIAMEVAISRTKKPQKLKDFLIKFKKKEVRSAEEMTEKEKQIYLQNSKNYWLGRTKASKRRNPPSKPVPPPKGTPIRKRR